MKGQTKWIIIAVSLIVCIQAVSAFGVSSITIDPSGSLIPGTPVIVSYRIDFTASGEETFPSTNEIQMISDLEKPKWTTTLVLDGVETAQPQSAGRIVTVSGWILSYPAEIEESLRVTMEGTVPQVQTTTNKTILQLQEADSHGNILSGSVVKREATVVNTGEIAARIAETETNLQQYRSHVDEKMAMGIDTAEGEAKYSEADSKIKNAKSRPSTQYLQTFADLDAAIKAIADGESALDRAWAENEVMVARVPINNVDQIIGWFRGNESTRNIPELQTIMTKREVAVSYISAATDEINSGNYGQARTKAQDAFNKGNESYTEAIKLQFDTEHGGFFSWLKLPTGLNKLIIPIIVVVVVVLVVVGIVIYRKRSRWDELG